MLMYVIHLSFHVLLLFSLYAHASYYLCTIFYFCFTLRCYDEFCLKYFKNTGCFTLRCHDEFCLHNCLWIFLNSYLSISIPLRG